MENAWMLKIEDGCLWTDQKNGFVSQWAAEGEDYEQTNKF